MFALAKPITAVAPVPLRLTVVGDAASLLVNTSVPLSVPATEGSNVIVHVAVLPGRIVLLVPPALIE